MNMSDAMTVQSDTSASRDLVGARAYRVDTRDGRIGTVAAVLPRAARSGSGVLLVQSGLLTGRLVAIPFDDVEEVDPARRRVVLRDVCRDRSDSRA
jgi:hypothetical protein